MATLQKVERSKHSGGVDAHWQYGKCGHVVPLWYAAEGYAQADLYQKEQTLCHRCRNAQAVAQISKDAQNAK